MPYASNCRISTPIALTTRADVDFNGLQFNYKIGLMFPAEAAMSITYIGPPPPSTLAQPINQTGGLH